jgi:hypothetical protein
MVTSLQVAGALVAGDGRPKLAPAATLSKPGAIHKPDAKSNVLAVRADVAAPADRRMRWKLPMCSRPMSLRTKRAGQKLPAPMCLVRKTKAFTEAAGIRILSSGGNFFGAASSCVEARNNQRHPKLFSATSGFAILLSAVRTSI